MFQIGDIEIHLIRDSYILTDGGGMFGLVPRKLWSRYVQPDENNLIVSNTLCLLVKADGKNIVIDTGFGSSPNDNALRYMELFHPDGTLLDGLKRLNLSPEDIDIVINTHLHMDHCNGNTYTDENGDIKATFPNAKHVVQLREYEDAMHPNERTRATYLPVNYEPLYKSGQLELLDGDTEIVSGVRGVVTPGHTPGHMSIVFESSGEHAMFVCDMASMAIHFERLAWMTAYDVEPLVTLESKRKWQQWAIEHDALLFIVHDPNMPVARLRPNEQGIPKMQAIEYEYS